MMIRGCFALPINDCRFCSRSFYSIAPASLRHRSVQTPLYPYPFYLWADSLAHAYTPTHTRILIQNQRLIPGANGDLKGLM